MEKTRRRKRRSPSITYYKGGEELTVSAASHNVNRENGGPEGKEIS